MGWTVPISPRQQPIDNKSCPGANLINPHMIPHAEKHKKGEHEAL
jgi:hypothetical protein